MTSNVNAPNFYLRSVKVKNDSLFGQQAYLDWDLHQLLGLDGPDERIGDCLPIICRNVASPLEQSIATTYRTRSCPVRPPVSSMPGV